MGAKVLMIQGTGSSVGKSITVAALCRIFKQDGWRVAPFKSQNMALNSFVTKEGGEMGRAQVVQAQAAGIEPHVDMNPILLKPEADAKSQVVLMGKPFKTIKARDYYQYTPELLPVALQALERLRTKCEIVVMEGAGSPAEINLREREIVNMKIALRAKAPVVVVGDIDKGGVFASLVGTLALLEPEEKSLVKGFIINKFRGDIKILQPGLEQLEKITGVPILGVIPYFRDFLVPEEDSIYRNIGEAESNNNLRIAVIRLPHISNSTDFEALQQEAGVYLYYVENSSRLGNPHLIIIPGSKTTIADLKFMRQTGLADEIVRLGKAGTPVVGICGGFQMIGAKIIDPYHVEAEEGEVEGLGLLNIVTTFAREKRTCQVKAEVVSGKGLLVGIEGVTFEGYEIHMGYSQPEGLVAPFLVTEKFQDGVSYPDGALSHNGLILGTYLHGLFDDANFRRAFLSGLRQRFGLDSVAGHQFLTGEALYNRLAQEVRQSLNIELIYKILNEGVK